MPLPSRSLAVVGAGFPNKSGPSRIFELSLCEPGEPVDLRPEPKNPKDERAIAVFSSRGIQLGYLTAERAPWIGAILKQGREVSAIFQQQSHWGAWIRIAFDGEKPGLPPRRADEIHAGSSAINPEPDFYPDEEWPD